MRTNYGVKLLFSSETSKVGKQNKLGDCQFALVLLEPAPGILVLKRHHFRHLGMHVNLVLQKQLELQDCSQLS